MNAVINLVVLKYILLYLRITKKGVHNAMDYHKLFPNTGELGFLFSMLRNVLALLNSCLFNAVRVELQF